MAKFNVGDRVIVECKRTELQDIGVCEDSTMIWLMDGKPKVIKEIVNKQLYLENPESPTHMIWVYTGMVYKAK